MIWAYGEGVGVEGRQGGPRCEKHGACPRNREGTCMGGPPGDKATKIVKTACEDEEFDLVPDAPESHTRLWSKEGPWCCSGTMGRIDCGG